ncbi:MAG: UDP-N-acetylmuramoyl-L-alanine--D-glutamate ligase [Deltaproteobacteria bacterium]|nr:UDP-N-acetylmuramoyl-L-alanine--D-glutamate ligase [Deltaproteobacteria bacterium]
MTVRGRSFSVVGMGRSGISAANALCRRGGQVVLSDGQDTKGLREAVANLHPGIETVLGGEVIRPGDTVVLSPGIPPAAPVFQEAHREGGEVIGEVELFHRLFLGRTVAVTGTDGKSTVTTLTAHLLRRLGHTAHAAGNLGNPLCDLLDSVAPDHVVVAEVSCFQLISTSWFHPLVALVTNLAEDHIEYHGSFDAYLRAKSLVAANQGAGDWFVRNRDDPLLSSWATPGHDLCPHRGQNVLEVSRRGPVENGAWFHGGSLYLAHSGVSRKVCDRKDISLPGGHNTENALLALAACFPFEPDTGALAEGLASYRGLPHRIEFLRELDGVRIYNDSKATNPHAAITALRAFDEPVVLIAGGHEKGLSFEDLAHEVDRGCRHVILVGETAERMSREFPDTLALEVVDDHETALRQALKAAAPAGVVLFSPAASSFDRFASYEERGDRFRRMVMAL